MTAMRDRRCAGEFAETLHGDTDLQRPPFDIDNRYNACQGVDVFGLAAAAVAAASGGADNGATAVQRGHRHHGPGVKSTATLLRCLAVLTIIPALVLMVGPMVSDTWPAILNPFSGPFATSGFVGRAILCVPAFVLYLLAERIDKK
jgi:hypothetical protein